VNDDSGDRQDVTPVGRRATSPVAGAIAGMLFAVLFSFSVVVIITTTSGAPGDTGAWLASGASRYRLAIDFIPFAGLFFLWFIGVARQQLGGLEDQFFATVFLGSGLLFLAMVFAAAAAAGAMAASYLHDPSGFSSSSTYFYARSTVAEIFTVYALKMAAVFMISGATLWIRTGVMPRWMALLTYAVAALFLFVASQSIWVVLLFPAWVFLVSAYILATHVSARRPKARVVVDGQKG
jgi:hypothetical protein